MGKITLTEECWTIGSFLRSAAAKFDEIAKDCRKPESSPSCASLASTFENQKKQAIEFAELFEQASAATIETEIKAPAIWDGKFAGGGTFERGE